MKITATFDTWEEFQNYMRIQPLEAPKATRAKEAEAKKSAETQENVEAKKPAEAQEDAPVHGMSTAPGVTEDFRVEVRKTLAQLNKKVGKNVASELIKGFGVDKLTEVALSDLPALMSKAKEALDAE